MEENEQKIHCTRFIVIDRDRNSMTLRKNFVWTTSWAKGSELSEPRRIPADAINRVPTIHAINCHIACKRCSALGSLMAHPFSGLWSIAHHTEMHCLS